MHLLSDSWTYAREYERTQSRCSLLTYEEILTGEGMQATSLFFLVHWTLFGYYSETVHWRLTTMSNLQLEACKRGQENRTSQVKMLLDTDAACTRQKVQQQKLEAKCLQVGEIWVRPRCRVARQAPCQGSLSAWASLGLVACLEWHAQTFTKSGCLAVGRPLARVACVHGLPGRTPLLWGLPRCTGMQTPNWVLGC